jgi:hypothetical protein
MIDTHTIVAFVLFVALIACGLCVLAYGVNALVLLPITGG